MRFQWHLLYVEPAAVQVLEVRQFLEMFRRQPGMFWQGESMIGPRRVVIESNIVSETDGQTGKIVGAERGYLVVQMDRWTGPMLFCPDEVRQV